MTRAEVEPVVAALRAEGLVPSTRLVRERLGRGSYRDIVRLLREITGATHEREGMPPVTIDPLHPPEGPVPVDAPSALGLVWLESFEAQHPGVFRLYWEGRLGGSCSRAANAQAAADWSPLAYAAAKTRLTAWQWQQFRLKHGMKAFTRGPATRRHGVPVEIWDRANANGHRPTRRLPTAAALCLACGTLTIGLTDEDKAHIVHYLFRQGKLPLEEASDGE